MYQKLLVPVDESEAAFKALTEACRLAKQLGARIEIVHVVDLAQLAWGGAGYVQASAIQDSSKELAARTIERAQSAAQQFQVVFNSQIIESNGDSIPGILVQQAKDRGCDLIVMGTHGFSGIMHLLMGSVAEAVVRHASVPVLLVRDSQK